MIKHMKVFEEMYYLLDQNEITSASDAENELIYIRTFEEFYRDVSIKEDGVRINENETLPLDKEQLEEINELQNRILDGFKYDINVLIEVVNDDNCKKIVELANFLLEKLKVNMWATEGKKRNLAYKQNYPNSDLYKKNKYPEENSLFVEVFFVEKLKEIANVDALQLRK